MNQKIELSLPKLRELKLSPNEYVYLYYLYHKMEAERFYHHGSLEQRGFIKDMGEGKISLREGALKLFEVPDRNKMFNEFFLTFPMKVPARNGASRPLRSATLDTEFAKKMKVKYFIIIDGKFELHKTIIASLEAEMEMRRLSSSFQFMHAMEVWLNQKDWEKYSYLIEEKKERDDRTKQEGTEYGQTLI